jgi:hypothetical protein
MMNAHVSMKYVIRIITVVGGATVAALSLHLSPLGVAQEATIPSVKPQPVDDRELLFLHVYSNRYSIHTMHNDLPRYPRPYQCIITLGFQSGTYFFADAPNHYEPEIEIEGRIFRRGDILNCNFSMSVQDVGIAIGHNQIENVSLNTLEMCKSDGEIYFVVSDSKTPPSPPPVSGARKRGNK